MIYKKLRMVFCNYAKHDGIDRQERHFRVGGVHYCVLGCPVCLDDETEEIEEILVKNG